MVEVVYKKTKEKLKGYGQQKKKQGREKVNIEHKLELLLVEMVYKLK